MASILCKILWHHDAISLGFHHPHKPTLALTSTKCLDVSKRARIDREVETGDDWSSAQVIGCRETARAGLLRRLVPRTRIVSCPPHSHRVMSSQSCSSSEFRFSFNLLISCHFLISSQSSQRRRLLLLLSCLVGSSCSQAADARLLVLSCLVLVSYFATPYQVAQVQF